MIHSVYILRCSDGSYYVGCARDVRKRVHTHNSGKGARYTRSRLPVVLVYSEECENKSTALKREWEIKKWKRKEKEALIEGGEKVLGENKK
jgi:predicted GIY-YIG superfamily endonuclease